MDGQEQEAFGMPALQVLHDARLAHSACHRGEAGY
jgi:hypothetical protein